METCCLLGNRCERHRTHGSRLVPRRFVAAIAVAVVAAMQGSRMLTQAPWSFVHPASRRIRPILSSARLSPSVRYDRNSWRYCRQMASIVQRLAGRSDDSAMDMLSMLQRPGAAEELKDVFRDLAQRPSRADDLNAMLDRINTTDPFADDADPFARLLNDQGELTSALSDPARASELMKELNRSALFADFFKMGSAVLEQMRIKKLEAGYPVQLVELVGAPELNGEVGVLADPTPEELQEHPDRRIVALSNGERLALLPTNLAFPRHEPGDAVTLETEFGGPEEGLEGSAAVVSELTDEEQELGFDNRGGRVVVDVLPLMIGGPILHRLLMWPELLRPRPYQPGDTVELAGLKSSAALNGSRGTVVAPESGELDGLPTGSAVVVLDADGQRLAVPRSNLLLRGVALPDLSGLG